MDTVAPRLNKRTFFYIWSIVYLSAHLGYVPHLNFFVRNFLDTNSAMVTNTYILKIYNYSPLIAINNIILAQSGCCFLLHVCKAAKSATFPSGFTMFLPSQFPDWNKPQKIPETFLWELSMQLTKRNHRFSFFLHFLIVRIFFSFKHAIY